MMTGKYPHNSGVFTNTGDDGGYATYLGHGNDPQTFAVALQKRLPDGHDGEVPQRLRPDHEPGVDGVDGVGRRRERLSRVRLRSRTRTERSFTTGTRTPTTSPTSSRGSVTAFVAQRRQALPHRDRHLRAACAVHARAAPCRPVPGPHVPADARVQCAPDGGGAGVVAGGARAQTQAGIAAIDEHYRMRVQAVQAFDEMMGRSSSSSRPAATIRTRTSSSRPTTATTWASALSAREENGVRHGHTRPARRHGAGRARGAHDRADRAEIDLCPTFAELAGNRPSGRP